MRYYRRRMGRMQGTPWFIAAGLATGIAVSFTPFVGFHLLLGAVLCWALRASMIAMVLGTVLGGNIWTLPLCLLASYYVGIYFLGHVSGFEDIVMTASPLSLIMKHPLEIFLPMMVGAVPLALLSWVVSFYAVQGMVRKYRKTAYQQEKKHQVKS